MHPDVLEWIWFLNTHDEVSYRVAHGKPADCFSCLFLYLVFCWFSCCMRTLPLLRCTSMAWTDCQSFHAAEPLDTIHGYWMPILQMVCTAGDKDTFRAAFDLAGKRDIYYQVSHCVLVPVQLDVLLIRAAGSAQCQAPQDGHCQAPQDGHCQAPQDGHCQAPQDGHCQALACCPLACRVRTPRQMA
jgi:hypothetical protein